MSCALCKRVQTLTWPGAEEAIFRKLCVISNSWGRFFVNPDLLSLDFLKVGKVFPNMTDHDG